MSGNIGANHRDAVDPTGTRTEQYFALLRRLKSTQKSVNPGLVRASATLPLNFNNQSQIWKDFTRGSCCYVLRVIHSNSPGRRCHYHCNGRVVAKPCTIQTKEANVNLGIFIRAICNNLVLHLAGTIYFVINRLSGWNKCSDGNRDRSTDNTGYYKNEGTAENIQIDWGMTRMLR